MEEHGKFASLRGYADSSEIGLYICMNGAVVLCPYCGHDLKVVPSRRKKCPSCTELVYVKSTPDCREKRLMTEAQATHAELLWVSYREREEALATLQAVGIDEGELEIVRKSGVGSDADAVVAILNRLAESDADLHLRKMAFYFLASAAEKNNQPSSAYRVRAIECELLGYSKSGITLVRVSKPGPWAPATEMAHLYEQGIDTHTIAKMTGFSVPTVERNLQTRGEDPRTGPHCERNSDRVFSIEQATREMPLPCGDKCICSWCPISPWDLK